MKRFGNVVIYTSFKGANFIYNLILDTTYLSLHNILKYHQLVKRTRLEGFSSMAKAFFRPYESLAQMREILATHVLQLPPFVQLPDALLQVEIRSIARKSLQL